MRGKDQSEKAFELLSYLDEAAFEYFFEKFTVDGAINDAGKDFAQVKKAFLEKFFKKEEPQDVICEATDAVLDPNDLLLSMNRLDSVYSRAGFNDEAKFGFLRVAVMKIPAVATFAMYRGVSSYMDLKKAVKDFDSGMRAFHAVSKDTERSAGTWLGNQEEKDMKLLVRPDARVQNMEAKIDTLADQMSSLTLLMKKGQEGSPKEHSSYRLRGGPSLGQEY